MLEIGRTMKAKISVSMDVELIQWLDDQTNRGVFKNRSQALNEILKEKTGRK